MLKINTHAHCVSMYSPLTPENTAVELGHRYYELSNHLGNVLTVISDVKTPISSGGNVASYTANIVNISDYSPFGVQLDGRTITSDRYRYGFQGQEKDDEVKGEGNSVNYKYRMHDPRIGRFFAIDPLIMKFPYYSPYGFSGNKVINAIELEGLEELMLEKIWDANQKSKNQKPKINTTNSIDIVTIWIEKEGIFWNNLIQMGYKLDRLVQGGGDKSGLYGITLVSTEKGVKFNNAAIEGIPTQEIDIDGLDALLKGGGKFHSKYPKLNIKSPESIAKAIKAQIKALDKGGLLPDPPDEDFDQQKKVVSTSESATNILSNAKKSKVEVFQEGYVKDGYRYDKVKYEGEASFHYLKAKIVKDFEVEVKESSSKSEFETAKAKYN